MNTAKAKILLIDDDPGILRLISIRLSAAGYDVVPENSGEKALAHMSLHRPHVVVTDLRMSGMDGMAVFDAIHQRNPTLPVIILTAHGTIPDAVAATKRGVFGFLTKPFDSKALLEQVEKALAASGLHHEAANNSSEDTHWRRGIITRNPVMEDVLNQARLVAESDISVFIHGESGTGKDLLARAIHKASPRADHPFVAINCSAIPEPLLESELFGHSKGSFTGATRDHKGLFQAADKGTLFLDEIGDMPMSLQAKLLRVLQDKEVRPIGATQSVAVDVRVISATHRNLEQEMGRGRFREDLFYRLNVVELEIPPLAQRREDIPPLALDFLNKLSGKGSRKVEGFSPEAMKLLVSASWPGNVRQLLNVVEQTVALSTTPIISTALVQKALRSEPGEILSFVDARSSFEREYLVQLLQISQGNVTQAARLAKRNRTEFYKLLRRHHLEPGLFKQAGQ
ncbi:MAG: sigma 54-interacting transcriptional regulator [Gammaproteobacteria bacterium]|jgi:two-component system response regulator GlrR